VDIDILDSRIRVAHSSSRPDNLLIIQTYRKDYKMMAIIATLHELNKEKSHPRMQDNRKKENSVSKCPSQIFARAKYSGYRDVCQRRAMQYSHPIKICFKITSSVSFSSLDVPNVGASHLRFLGLGLEDRVSSSFRRLQLLRLCFGGPHVLKIAPRP
jgi:hypothetical protein